MRGSKLVFRALFGLAALIWCSSVTAQNDDASLNAEQRQEVIEKLASELRAKYVFPELGEEMAALVETSLKEEEYNECVDAEAFAELLTDQLRGVCKDLHLRVRPGSPAQRMRRRDDVGNHSNGFVKAEYLPGNIGYLKFNGFHADKDAEDTAAAAMNFLSNADALIFDVRENGGGSPNMIEFLCGYLFDESVHLNSFYNRPSDSTSTTWSRTDVPGKRFGEEKPVYVLTSQYTFSAAEEFTYDLKHLDRGVVVGETTGGGAHPVMPVTLGAKLYMTMPFARAINPITKTNWEGVGVKPHVEVAASEALEAAVELAKSAISEQSDMGDAAERDPDSEISTQSVLRRANELMSRQEFASASVQFRRVIEADPNSADAWFGLGYCLHVSGQLVEAIEVHKKAAEFEAFAPVATFNLACAYSLLEKPDEAIDAMEKAIELGFDDLGQIKRDSDLDNIRDDDRFVKLLEMLDDNRR